MPCLGLPPYNDDLIRSSIRETEDHYNEMYNILKATRGEDGDDPIPSEYQPVLSIHDASMERNKRCLIAYHAARMSRLRGLRWETAILPQDVRRNLSSAEVEYFHNFDSLLVEYGVSTGHDVSSGDLSEPPKELYVTVRVIRDAGEIVTESGSMVLNKGTTHHVRRADVEGLIREGVVELLMEEES